MKDVGCFGVQIKECFVYVADTNSPIFTVTVELCT